MKLILHCTYSDKKLNVQLPDFDNEVFCTVNLFDIQEKLSNQNSVSKYQCILEFKSLKAISVSTYLTIVESVSGIRFAFFSTSHI